MTKARDFHLFLFPISAFCSLKRHSHSPKKTSAPAPMQSIYTLHQIILISVFLPLHKNNNRELSKIISFFSKFENSAKK